MTLSSLPQNPHYSAGDYYDPQSEYYSLSYYVVSSPKWIRSPFLRLHELKDALEDLPILLTPSAVPSRRSELPGILRDYEELQIYSESWLSKLHKDWDEPSQSYIDSEYTNRQIIFGKMYEHNAVRFTGIPSLSRQSGEDLDAWRARVGLQRNALKELHTERVKLLGELREQQNELSSLFDLGKQGLAYDVLLLPDPSAL